MFSEVSSQNWYVVPGPTGGAIIVPGKEAALRSTEVLGEAVLAAKAPKRSTAMSEFPLEL